LARLGIDAASLPIIWDADFLYGPHTPSGQDTYILCEINVSSVFAIPDQAPAAIPTDHGETRVESWFSGTEPVGKLLTQHNAMS
jgi:hypothetical protein